MRVAIVGSRLCSSANLTLILRFIPKNCTEIVSGGARGIDTLAAEAAKATNRKLTRFVPDYGIFGRSAPLVRNIEIITYADIVLAFWDMKSKGTRFVIEECLKRHIPVKIIPII